MKDLYGLIGYPLGHSFSAKYFAEKLAAEGIDAVYRNFERPSVVGVREWAEEEKALRGFNVTIPHKQNILGLLDTLSPEAGAIGAVNVVRVERTATGVRLHGYNSDVVGFSRSLSPLLQPHHRRALVLGTGGASLAVCHALRSVGVAVTSVSRTAREGRLTYEDLTPEVMQTHTVVVNCTPLGTFPKVEECPPIPYDCLTERHLLYDLVYNPAETKFLLQGKERGATTKNGLEMLHLQAEAAWEMWHSLGG